jgi:glycosyltransferase involved in cell wall biosynthesis
MTKRWTVSGDALHCLRPAQWFRTGARLAGSSGVDGFFELGGHAGTCSCPGCLCLGAVLYVMRKEAFDESKNSKEAPMLERAAGRRIENARLDLLANRDHLDRNVMRIAQIAPLAESVPPKLYGGTERVVAWLVDELVKLGHDVTLFASGDSVTRAKLVSVWPRAVRLGRPRSDPMVIETALLEAMSQATADFDLIHAHIDWLHLPLLSRLGVPFLTTLHGRLDWAGLPDLVRLFPNAPFISISDNQRLPLGAANWCGTVYHGVPPNMFRPSFEPGSYLAFLGRLSADKGPEAAIRIARASGIPLLIAAKVPSADRGYFKKQLEPQIDGKRVQLSGEVDDAAKERFLAGAAALLFPINWPEPFGLAMIEAMACGTPVIAFRCGSVPEVVDDGITGFVVDGEQEAVQAISRVRELDRRRVRSHFEQRFTAKRMAMDYLRHYQNLVATKSKSLS